jgi:hypothetical protein
MRVIKMGWQSWRRRGLRRTYEVRSGLKYLPGPASMPAPAAVAWLFTYRHVGTAIIVSSN